MTVEAVNSVIQAAPVLRASAEQTSTASTSGNPGQIQKVAEAPYVSPYLTVDVATQATVLEIRDSSTGKVLQQIPSQSSLDARRFAQNQTPPPQQPQPQTQPAQTAAPPAVTISPPPPQQNNTQATVQQVAAFTDAAQAGNTNAGAVSLFA
jgi:uncharacterized FlaG/YvyC family protein